MARLELRFPCTMSEGSDGNKRGLMSCTLFGGGRTRGRWRRCRLILPSSLVPLACDADVAPKRMSAEAMPHERDGTGEYLQVYTRTFDDRFFFEIVERRGYQGFGAANASIRLAAQSRLAVGPLRTLG